MSYEDHELPYYSQPWPQRDSRWCFVADITFHYYNCPIDIKGKLLLSKFLLRAASRQWLCDGTNFQPFLFGLVNMEPLPRLHSQNLLDCNLLLPSFGCWNSRPGRKKTPSLWAIPVLFLTGSLKQMIRSRQIIGNDESGIIPLTKQSIIGS